MGQRKKFYRIQGGCVAFSTTKNGPRRVVGNTPTVELEPTTEIIDVKSAKDGARVTDDETVIEKDASLNLTLQEFIAENLKPYFLSTGITSATQAAATGETLDITISEFNALYPLGKDNVTITSVVNKTQANAPLTEGVDWRIDKPGRKHGEIYVCETANITLTDEITVTFDVAETEQEEMNGMDGSEVELYVHFLGSSVKGPSQRVTGYAIVRPNDNLAMIDDGEYGSFGLTCKFILKDDIANGEGLFEYKQINVTGRP